MKVYIHRLGCPKNDVDADYISARITDDGHLLTQDPEEADTIIVNTCGFILPAKEESIQEIIRLGQLKKDGSLQRLFAAGCLSQRYGQELLDEIKELDGAFGVGALEPLADAVAGNQTVRKSIRTDAERMRYIGLERRQVVDRLPYAYLKISDGCNRTCGFCAIPSIRGQYRSRPMDALEKEARFLVEQGKKELILVSQESTLYGHDLGEPDGLIGLLKRLDKIDGLEWIRLMYLYPTQVSSSMIDYLLDCGNKTLDYFDIPLQHISDKILNEMDRRTTRLQIEKFLESIRSKGGRATIRTAFIVGFPGENEADFEELLDFVEEQRFDRLGGFLYSSEEGTVAGEKIDTVTEEEKQERLDRLMSLQQGIAFEKNNSLIGKRQQVIIDSVLSKQEAIGRTRADCPEIDQQVTVSGRAEVGDVGTVLIDSSDGYDLSGSRCED
jgi:ribosomal protein S12 methylthiotransferase